MCEKVLDRCLAPSTAGGEGCDNMTMILVQFKKPFPSEEVASAEENSCSGKEIDGEEKGTESREVPIEEEEEGSSS